LSPQLDGCYDSDVRGWAVRAQPNTTARDVRAVSAARDTQVRAAASAFLIDAIPFRILSSLVA
jgi:hypothetical protein